MTQNGLSRNQKRQLRQATDDARAVLNHEPSMRFLIRIIEESGYFTDAFTGNSETFHRLGKRATGIRIIESLQMGDEDALTKLLQTATKERAKNSANTGEQDDAH